MFMVPKMFEPLTFECISLKHMCVEFLYYYNIKCQHTRVIFKDSLTLTNKMKCRHCNLCFVLSPCVIICVSKIGSRTPMGTKRMLD